MLAVRHSSRAILVRILLGSAVLLQGTFPIVGIPTLEASAQRQSPAGQASATAPAAPKIQAATPSPRTTGTSSVAPSVWMADYSAKKALVSYDGGSTIAYSASLDGTALRAAVSVPGNLNSEYYPTTGGTLWQTADGGQTFTQPIELSLPAGEAEDITLNPANPQQIYIYWYHMSS